MTQFLKFLPPGDALKKARFINENPAPAFNERRFKPVVRLVERQMP
jgi:hypothetical protein